MSMPTRAGESRLSNAASSRSSATGAVKWIRLLALTESVSPFKVASKCPSSISRMPGDLALQSYTLRSDEVEKIVRDVTRVVSLVVSDRQDDDCTRGRSIDGRLPLDVLSELAASPWCLPTVESLLRADFFKSAVAFPIAWVGFLVEAIIRRKFLRGRGPILGRCELDYLLHHSRRYLFERHRLGNGSNPGIRVEVDCRCGHRRSACRRRSYLMRQYLCVRSAWLLVPHVSSTALTSEGGVVAGRAVLRWRKTSAVWESSVHRSKIRGDGSAVTSRRLTRAAQLSHDGCRRGRQHMGALRRLLSGPFIPLGRAANARNANRTAALSSYFP